MKYRSSLLLLLFCLLYLVHPLRSTMAQIGTVKSYPNAAVVSAKEPASEIGSNILQMGGNAVDAAVAVNFALAVTYPQAGNIGGGGFMVIHMQGDTTIALDFCEVAPDGAHDEMYLDENGNYVEQRSREGILSVGVPGTVDGMIRAPETLR